MQIQSGSSLLDYLDNPEQSQSVLESLAKGQKKADVGTELSSFESNFTEGQMESMLERIESGEANISLQSIGNMISFNMRPVAADLQQMAERLGIEGEVQLQQVDGKWQVQGLEIESDADADAKEVDPALQKLQHYLDKNTGLQDKLDQLNRLSEFYEWGQTREFAAELKAADVPEQSVVDYLKNSREYLLGMDSFSLSAKGFYLNSQGEAQALYDTAKKHFNVED